MNFKKIIATFSLLVLIFSTPLIPTSVSNAAPSCPICGGIVRPGANHSCCDVLGHNYSYKHGGSRFLGLKSHTVNGKNCNYELWQDFNQKTCGNCGQTNGGYYSTREELHSCGR